VVLRGQTLRLVIALDGANLPRPVGLEVEDPLVVLRQRLAVAHADETYAELWSSSYSTC
jgi:hypothetical protein